MSDKEIVETLRDVVQQYRSMTETLQGLLDGLEKSREKTPAVPEKKKGGR